MLSKSKDIAKGLEGCSKSYFSHLRDEVVKNTLKPIIWNAFGLVSERLWNTLGINCKSFMYNFELI